MLIENPQPNAARYTDAPYCAIRERRADGTPDKGAMWLEPLGSCYQFLEDQKTYEVVFYAKGDVLPD